MPLTTAKSTRRTGTGAIVKGLARGRFFFSSFSAIEENLAILGPQLE
jgi:hypothetical protein